MSFINKLIYLDNAATGFPKPDSVKKAVIQAFDTYGGNPGRSGHELSVGASKAIFSCREKVCELLNFSYPERVVFTQNATYALNIAIKGIAEKGSHILISNLEHNSVYRPVYSLCNDPVNEMEYSLFDATAYNDDLIIKNFKKSIRHNTKLAVVTAASNVCGRILPLKELSAVCKENKIKLIIDASQLLGVVEFNFEEISPDVVCSAGHKGLYGPSGTGFAVFSEETNPNSVISGGNGIVSSIPDMGEVLPEKLEAGTLNTVGICGLEAGIKHILDVGVDYIGEKCGEIEKYITQELIGLGAILYSSFNNKTPIILFNFPKASAEHVTGFLDDSRICTRGGIHCSPLAHKALGTGEYGAVRISPGHFNTLNDAKRLISVINGFLKTYS